jgi:hypothetical protein
MLSVRNKYRFISVKTNNNVKKIKTNSLVFNKGYQSFQILEILLIRNPLVENAGVEPATS